MVDRIGYWKNIDGTYAYPRTEFFRDAQRANLSFEIVLSLTALKFLWDEENYHDVGPQPLYIGRILEEPDYINKEMAAMLIRAHQKLGKFPSFSRIKMQIDDYVRSMLLKRDLDPARIKFWLGKGGQIRIWRKRHGLKDPVSLDTTEKSTV